MHSLQNPLDLECLQGFDHQRFGVLARSLQVLLAHGAMEYAIAAIRQFAVQTRRVPATPSSQLVDVVGVRMANALEEVGCTTVAAFMRLCDAQILAIPNLGDCALATRERLRLELAKGKLLEEWDSEGLEFDFLDAELPHAVVHFLERNMSACTSSVSSVNVSVFDALKILSERRDEAAREIDAKIIALEDEIASLKRMQKLLGTPKTRKPISGDLAKVASSMANVLVGKALKPGEIAGIVGGTAIQIGKIAANDARFKRCSDGRIALA